MKKHAVLAVAMVLLAQLAGAAWVAVLYGDYPAADPALLQFVPMPDGTQFSVAGNAASYAGHYGNYTVTAVRNEHNITLVLYGSGESKEALEKEFAWIGGVAGIKPDICPNYTLQPEAGGNYFACNGNVKAYYAQNVELPPVPPPPSNNGGGEVAPQGGVGQTISTVAAFVKGALGALFGTAGQQGQAGTAAERDAAAAGAKAATTACPALAAILIIIVAAFLLLSGRQEIPPGPVAPEIRKLLANETRSGIMQELSQADKIPTHLSMKLGVSKPAIVNRLAELVEAGLVEKVEVPGKKFVHYRLTQKGRQVLLRMAS